MNSISKKILNKMQNLIDKYSLFEGKDVYVAYSGGKDSLLLCLMLLQLGYNVSPITIDIGYGSDWSVATRNIEDIGLNILMLDMNYVDRFMPEIKSSLKNNFELIKQIKNGNFKKANICTLCYNSKMIILKRWAEINGVHTIAYGHHATDAIASLLKSFYMYQDRWEYGHEEFSYNNFYKLIYSQKHYYQMEKNTFITLPLGNEIKSLIQNSKVGTDEPIFQNMYQSSIRLCRPLFKVFEREILDYFDYKGNIFNESECFITDYRNKQSMTPRELIHHELLKNAPESLLEYLLELAELSLDKSGNLKFNARNCRAEILGEKYKNEKINNIKM